MASDETSANRLEISAKNDDDTITIDLVELFFRLVEKMKWIIVASLLGALIAGVYSFSIAKPRYQATSGLYILNSSDSVVKLSDLQIGASLANDYMEVFNNWHVHEVVMQRLGLDYTYSQLQSMVSVRNPSNTRILYITAEEKSPEAAKDLADTYADVASEFIAARMKTDMPSVFEEALLPSSPSRPRKTRNVAVGFFLGFILAVGVLTVQFILDDRIRSTDMITKRVGLPIFGMVPVQEGNDVDDTRKGKGKGSGRYKGARDR